MSDQASRPADPAADHADQSVAGAGRSDGGPPSADRPALGYEQARDELMRIVQQLESGSAPLEEALTLWERGEELALICQQWLDGARARIEAARPGTD